jgi:hypothetical protein
MSTLLSAIHNTRPLPRPSEGIFPRPICKQRATAAQLQCPGFGGLVNMSQHWRLAMWACNVSARKLLAGRFADFLSAKYNAGPAGRTVGAGKEND